MIHSPDNSNNNAAAPHGKPDENVKANDTNQDDSLTVELTYEKNIGIRPWFYMRPLTRQDDHNTAYGGSSLQVETTIRNGRGADCTLDQNSFALVSNVSTKLSNADFYQHPETIRTTYYDEMKALLQRQTGAERVVILHHQVRNASEVTKDGTVQGYANGIHTDSAPSSAQTTLQAALDILRQQEEEEEEEAGAKKTDNKTRSDETVARYSKGRFLYINCWRNISDDHPITDNHLAVCDETSLVKPDDYLESDLYLPQGKLHQYRLNAHNAAQHRWYYFPQMTKSEVLLFKQWDSDTQLTGRVCFHTNVMDPSAAATSLPARESIEVRAVCFFPHHTPDTIQMPTAPKSLPEAETVAAKMLNAIRGISYWPRTGKIWLVSRVQRQDWQGLVHGLLRDDQNYFGVKDASAAVKQTIQEYLLKELPLEQTARQAAQQCRSTLTLTDSVLVQLMALPPATGRVVMVGAVASVVVAAVRKWAR